MTNSPSRLQKGLEKGNFRLRNMLASVERTFLPAGSTIGKYRIIEEIDRGGMAVVYKAVQLDLDREVALKVMPANITINRRFVERFLTEAHAVAKLSHPNIVSIYEVATENSIYYLSMEYIPGKNLYYYLHFHKPKLVDVLEIMSRLSDALAYAHRQRIIHRDLKLNNVIMKDPLDPVLIDFGLAKALEDDVDGGITRTGEIMGSPSYMAPERLLGGVVDHRSDICSLGIMLYEMLTFKNPYLDQRNLHQTTINVMEASPIPPRKLVPWLPVEIEAITLKAMAKDPAVRYQSMEEFKADINRYQRGEPVVAQPPSAWSRLKRFTKRNWAPLVISGIVALFSTLFAVSWYVQSQKERSHWQLAYLDRFNRDEETGWTFGPDKERADSEWVVVEGALMASASGFSYASLERPFNRDILIEFEVSAAKKDLHSAGFFLYGAVPDSGYCFHINRRGNAEYGVTFPGSRFLMQDIEGSRVVLQDVNHVAIERIQNAISFSINGIVVARVWDYLPPVGRNHENVGFFVDGCEVVFDNLRIHRRAIPQVPSPTLIADRFWERGDFDAALEEYRGLLQDFGSTDNAKEIQVRMADCLIRLQKSAEALDMLRKCSGLKSKDEAVGARLLYLEGVVHASQENEPAADSVFQRLAHQYPVSPVNHSAMAFALVKIAERIDRGHLQHARQEISTLSGQYPRYSEVWGRLHLGIVAKQVAALQPDSAVATAQAIIAGYPRDNEVLASTKIALGRIWLHKGKTDKAADIFNQSIAAHTSSDRVWDAWMELAAIYEYDFAYKDAMTIYQKIYRECPRSLPVTWMAAVRLGELSLRDSSFADQKAIFTEVADSAHPYPVPRLLAEFYLGRVSESAFRTAWTRLGAENRSYLYYFARKAMFKNEMVVARVYLQEYKQNLPERSWEYFRVFKIINNLSRW